jgi:Protein of unknown function (DUF3035)
VSLTYRPYLAALGVIALIGPVLGGCDDFRRAIGLEKVVPDEFAVVSRAPLSLPPDFALRPPRAGAQRPQEVPPVVQARDTVFRLGDDKTGTLPPAADQRSPGESELLREAGAANAPSDIRQLVDRDATSANDMSDSFVDKLAFWRKDDKPASPDVVIDPTREAERLAALKQDAKPADTSAAVTSKAPSALVAKPTIERTKPASSWVPSFSWLGKLF